MRKALLLLLVSGALFGGSVRIFNDSPYPLSAEILAANGASKGKVSIAPQQQSNWNDNATGNSVWSETPYTIVLTCKNGKQFGVISGVQQGGTVTALSAKGNLFCEADDEQQQTQHPARRPRHSQQQPPQQQFSPQTPLDSPQGSSSPGSAGPADTTGSPTDPNWGPP